ncbi:MAG: hypothetical protein ACREJC_12370 [Tepidisphaeraceae bacterium]
MKYTWYGDGNFDGTINIDDYAFIDGGFLLNLTGWLNGDYDYSGGKPNLDDYALIDGAFLLKGGVLSEVLGFIENGFAGEFSRGEAIDQFTSHLEDFGPEYAGALLSAIPEPGLSVLAATGLCGLLARRCRRY